MPDAKSARPDPRKAKPKKGKGGRPPKSPADRVKICSTSLPPAAVAYITARGDGSESKGLRRVVLESMGRAE